jgi:CRP-like cAMP-binding protein
MPIPAPAGPSVLAVGPWEPGNLRHQLLNDEERSRIAEIATVVRFRKGDLIYKRGDKTQAAFNIISGVVATYAPSSNGPDHITAFVYPGDIFGLSGKGRYTNSAKAKTAVSAYRLPIGALRRLMAQDANLDLAVISKLCEALREAQRHAFILSKTRAASRIAMFLEFQERLQKERGEPNSEIEIPMDRSAIAEYCGLTLSAVSRAFYELIKNKTVAFRDRHHLNIIDRPEFERIANTTK